MMFRNLAVYVLAIIITVGGTSCIRQRHGSSGRSRVERTVTPSPQRGDGAKRISGKTVPVPKATGALFKDVQNLAESVLTKVSNGYVSSSDMTCWTRLYEEYTISYLKAKDSFNENERSRIEYNLEMVDKIIIQNPVSGSEQGLTNYSELGFTLPPFQFNNDRKYSYWYTDGNMNLKMLEEVCDYNLPYTKAFANHLASNHPGSFNLEQVCDIFEFCYSRWRYVNDPKVNDADFIACASESIAASLTGDCDDFAVLIASCIFAVGGNARIICAHRSDSGHAYCEVDVTGLSLDTIRQSISQRFNVSNISDINTRSMDGRTWLNLDWQTSFPGGRYWDASRHDYYYIQNGKWQWHN